MLSARFPRAYVDVNREPYELDPDMFLDVLPSYVNVRSPRVAAGLGTIAKVVAQGEPIYDQKMTFQEALCRIGFCYHPYHQALRDLIDETQRQFGVCILVDGHSMPSLACHEEGYRRRRDIATAGVDIVLGDCYGTACSPVVMDTVARTLSRFGYRIARNAPYAGGYTTRHYGRPQLGVHAIQIEINRSLYMDEARLEPKPFLSTLSEHIRAVVDEVGSLKFTRMAAE